jgi:hypothetical protein
VGPPPPSNQPFFAFTLPNENSPRLPTVDLFAIALLVAWHYVFHGIDVSGYPSPDAYTRDGKYRFSKRTGHRKNNEIMKEKKGKFTGIYH